MSLSKRGSWWIDFVTPDRQRVRESAETGNRFQAQELHDRLKNDAWRLYRLGDRPKRTWQDAVEGRLREQSHKATHEEDRSKLRWLDHYLVDLEIGKIDGTLIGTITEAKRAEGCRNATINRTLALVRAILRRCAREWDWLDRAPAVRLLKEPTRRIRFLSREQAQNLLRELPPHLKDMASFTLATGLRASSVTGLCWDQVDLGRRLTWIHPDQAKARKAIAVPRNGTAMRGVRAQFDRHPVFVFTHQGRPVKQVSTKAWYKALARAGIDNFRWLAIVQPRLVIALGLDTYGAMKIALHGESFPCPRNLREGVVESFRYLSSDVWCQAHPAVGGYHRTRAQVAEDWRSMAARIPVVSYGAPG